MSKSIVSGNSSFYIFGAGNTALKVKNILQSNGKSVLAFIVSSGIEKKIDDISVFPLDNISKVDINIPIVIAIFNREPNAFLSDIISLLKSFGFTKIITFPEFHSYFPNQLGDIFWLTDKNYYAENIDKYYGILKILEDQQSIYYYTQIIEYFKTFNPEILQKPDFSNQYFPKDIDVWDGKGAFLDIGSYDGENILDAYNSVGQLNEVIAFEPDLVNFKKIVCNEKIKQICDRYFLYPCGVWSQTTVLKFNSGVGESSSHSVEGDQIVPVIKIDDIIHTQVGYIKMDIEGAEIDALLGSKEIICRNKPSLAISLYHRPDHFFLIPKIIYSWNLGYKFHVRLHANNLFETVLYCIQ